MILGVIHWQFIGNAVWTKDSKPRKRSILLCLCCVFICFHKGDALISYFILIKVNSCFIIYLRLKQNKLRLVKSSNSVCKTNEVDNERLESTWGSNQMKDLNSMKIGWLIVTLVRFSGIMCSIKIRFGWSCSSYSSTSRLVLSPSWANAHISMNSSSSSQSQVELLDHEFPFPPISSNISLPSMRPFQDGVKMQQ